MDKTIIKRCLGAVTSALISTLISILMPISLALLPVHAGAQSAKPIDAGKARVVAHWTPDRRAAAIPRDLVIDPRGLGYLRRTGGYLEPYGHQVVAQAAQLGPAPSPFGRPIGGDTTPPTISNLNPAEGATIGGSYTFSATVTDASGVSAVSVKVRKGSASAQSFAAARTAGSDTWTVTLQGFTDGAWSWWVEARDGAAKGGNVGTSAVVNFTVSTGGGSSGGGGGDTVTSASWSAGGQVQTAAGRLYFEMPSNAKRRGPWTGYVCSGTVAVDDTSGRSLIITASHCVYDDVNKAFARNVMFIPDQAATTGTGTDRNCDNDPIGCWVPSFGVVDTNWTNRTFPDNVAWDYAFYVVADAGAHQGNPAVAELDLATTPLAVSFAAAAFNDGTAGATTPDFTYALGYSYSEDPKFMYCAEDMTVQGTVNWWLPSCGLTGGSSGGPWVQPMVTATGNGPIISLNSWGYTNQPGMAGPKLFGTSAACVFGAAKSEAFPGSPPLDGDAGKVVACP